MTGPPILSLAMAYAVCFWLGWRQTSWQRATAVAVLALAGGCAWALWGRP